MIAQWILQCSVLGLCLPSMSRSSSDFAGVYSAMGLDEIDGKRPLDGTLYGDVYNWADMIQNYIKQVAEDGIRRDVTQELFDKAEYDLQVKDGSKVVNDAKKELTEYFRKKRAMALKIARKAVEIHDNALRRVMNKTYKLTDNLNKLNATQYLDSDIPGKLKYANFELVSFFKQKVSRNYSTVKIADEVPRELNETIFAVMWTHELEAVFKQNYLEDKSARWQYFGSSAGITRIYPGREWNSNFVGFYNDYDSRVRPWYIAATSGPKDVVIVMDCSQSMLGEKFGIARAVAKAVIRTLTKQDYLNVVCARASHWDEVGKWHFFKSEVLSCQENRMVPATIEFRKDLMEKIDGLIPGGTSELEHGFQLAMGLLNSKTRTGCQSVLVFITDGRDTDGEGVRCGPGYYTRSGYVPGPVCKYDWNKVWRVVNETNEQSRPPARIFSYLIKDDGQMFPGALSCNHSGSMRRLRSGENLISQMTNYFDFLARSAKNTHGLWTSPYIDAFGLVLLVTHAVPVISKINGKTIGVAGVDATLEEIETFLTRHQWGSVTTFLIDKEGQTIYHPLLKSSTTLKDDPIFIHIQRLEQDKKGKPKNFTKIYHAMISGITGMTRIEDGRRGVPKGDHKAGVKYDTMPLEYYYSNIENSDYAFSFVLSDTDKTYRKLKAPKVNFESLTPQNQSYFNLLIEYNSTIVKKEYPKVFKYLDVHFNESKYQKLRVSYKHSSIFFAPKCYCEQLNYFFDDDLATKTLVAHRYMNKLENDTGCINDKDGRSNNFEEGIRAYVLVTQPIEEMWRQRKFDWVKEVIWTYVGMRSGVFRTYPGHRSTRLYDPTKRPWYRRTMTSPTKISISTPYYDSAGSGKIITLSQAVFEGMEKKISENCQTKPKSGGCPCDGPDDCISGVCYVSVASAFDDKTRQEKRCATERIEAITSLDLIYNNFHQKLYKIMTATVLDKSCNSSHLYDCPDGEKRCKTMCYLFDNRANVIMAPEFLTATDLDTGQYKGITLGKKEGEVMKELTYRHKFFQRVESIDFQGECSFTGGSPKVTMSGIPTTPEEADNYYKTRGPISAFSNSYGCIQDMVSFEVDEKALGPSRMLVGNVSGPCMSGFYYVTSLKETNLFLLVIENWKDKSKNFYNFNCQITRRIVASGAYRIINGTCAHDETTEETLYEQKKCPELRNISIPCEFTGASCVINNWIIICFLQSILALAHHMHTT